MSKQDKYTRSAKGKACQIRIPGYCKPAPDNETTVLAHLPGGGVGNKRLNIHGAYSCDVCHDIVDGRLRTEYSAETLALYHHEGVIRTQIIMINDGIIEVSN